VADVFQFQTAGVAGADIRASAPILGNSGGQITVGVNEASRYGSGSFNSGVQLPEFLTELVRPKLEAQARRKMYEGFAAAREGVALEEIINDQPWYSRIFGQTSFEQGATTYHALKSASDMEQAFMEELPELRKLDSAQIGQRLNDITEKGLTGDMYANAALQKAIMDRAGPMLELHAKSRFEWQQQELALGENSAWQSASSAYQRSLVDSARQGKQNPNQPLSAEDMQERKRLFLETFQAAPGRDPAGYMKNLMTTVEQLADKGEWYSVSAIYESGVLGQLPPEMRDRLDSRIDTARTKFKRNLGSGPLMRPVAQLFTQAKAGAISAEDAVNGMQEINMQYAALTGDDTGMFDQDDAIRLAESAGGAYYSMWERMMNKRDAAKEKAVTAAEKEAAEARGDAQLAAAVTTNSVGTVVHMKGVAAEDADRAFNSVVTQNPNMLADVTVGNYAVSTSGKEPYVSPRLKTRLQNQVALSAGEEYTEGFETAYQAWKSIRYHEIDNGTSVDRTSGLSTAIEYYGEFQNPMQQYDDQVRTGVPREVAYRRTFGNEASFGQGDLRGVDSQATREARDKLSSVVANLNPSWWQLGSESMGASANNVVTNAASRYFEQIKKNDPAISDSDAASQSIQMAQANGLEISGRYAWQNVRGQKPLYAEAGMQKDVFEDYFEQVLTNRFRTQGISVAKDTSISILRIGNDAKGPRMMATAYRDGVRKTIWITGDDIKSVRNKQAQDEITRRQQFAPPGYYYDPKTKSMQPSISIQPKL
jgi:hypothetical protein